VSLSPQRVRHRQPPEQTRRQILAAAVEFLSEHSFRELSVDALMARTGYSRTLFYRHFDSTASLLLALIEQAGGELVALAEDWSHSDRVGPEITRQRLARFVRFHARNGPVARAVAEAAHHDPAVEGAYSALIEGFVRITTEGISTRIEAGELPPLDAPEIARALVRMLLGYLLDPARTLDPERTLDTVWTIWTRTLFPGEAPN
jgi:AcrR family transcriptional regulator